MVYKSKNIKRPTISFETEIQLGNPKHQCQSLGICKIEPALSIEQELINVNNKNRVAAKVVFENNRLIFFFNKTTMAEQTRTKFFGGDFFIVLSAVELPSFISEKLKVPYEIDVGNYPITKEEDVYKVLF